MKRFVAVAAAAALLVGAVFVGPVQADETKEAPALVQMGEKLPAPGELIMKDGTDEGFKKPGEVLARALKAAKEDKLADLKACLLKEGRDSADEESWDGGDDKLTNLQVLAKFLKSVGEEVGNASAQNTVGTYAVIPVKSAKGTHLVRMVLEDANEGAEVPEGEEAPKAKPNWYLGNYRLSELDVDYGSPQIAELREAIKKGDAAKLKERISEWESQTLELLSGVQEGVDPYALLAKRLQKIGEMGEKPTVLLNRYTNSVAYWFHSDKGDAFLCLRFDQDFDWQNNTRNTKVMLDLPSISSFHTNAAGQFSGWVANYDWMQWK
ncbi:MAG: hypothetical protein IT463_04980 [Planctomycetes bacterium]|nr:hypothetical protein [Planctomycetota bacterium]